MNKKKNERILWDRVIIAVALLLIIILLISTGISKLIHSASKDENDKTIATDASSTSEESTEPENTINSNYDFIEVSNDDVHKGNLVLVNSNHQFSDATVENLVKIIDKKSGDYKVAYSDAMLNEEVILKLNDMAKVFAEKYNIYDLMLSHTYRTMDDQQSTYDNAVKNNSDLTQSQYLKPGFTELHTGIAFDFGIFPNGNVNPKFDGTGDYSWFSENAPYYGFVLRYPQDKEDITGVKYDVTHYRYVGLPHSAYMKQDGLCLEEYLDKIKEYKFEQNPLSVSIGDDSAYEIYFIALGAEGTTLVPVPKDMEYTISGNNYDGFIVTVKTK